MTTQRHSPSHNPGITVRPASSLDDFRAVEELQLRAWSITDRAEIVPLHVLLTVQKNGGLVLGAFTDAGLMVGILFGFLGRHYDGSWKHCSHIMGVLPEYRGKSIGYLLKMKQREMVLQQGLKLITWTFDPLESANAYLNFSKLDVISREYYPDMYGEIADLLNRGLPSDRLQVEWWLEPAEETVKLRSIARDAMSSSRGIIRLIEVQDGPHGPVPLDVNLSPGQEVVLLNVPGNFQAVKRGDPQLASEWRKLTRRQFQACLDQGYVVSGYGRLPEPAIGQNAFCLVKPLSSN